LALARVGAPKPDATPLARHLQELLRARSADGPAVDQAADRIRAAAHALMPVADLLYAARFAGSPPEPAAVAHAETVVRQVARLRDVPSHSAA
jgi:hypothetical protein